MKKTHRNIRVMFKTNANNIQPNTHIFIKNIFTANANKMKAMQILLKFTKLFYAAAYKIYFLHNILKIQKDVYS